MDYDPMVMDDSESLGPVVKISQVRFSVAFLHCNTLHPPTFVLVSHVADILLMVLLGTMLMQHHCRPIRCA